MTFGKKIYDFYSKLNAPVDHPDGIDVLLPFLQEETKNVNEVFYDRFYDDNNSRIFLIGINPGRFGAGITGIPFTDPVNLEKTLGISNSFDKKHELSSRFIYSIIDRMDGPDVFFQNFYFTAVSPVGFISEGRNINYYDKKELLTDVWESFYVDNLKIQIKAGANTECAYSLGAGMNIKYLEYLNDKFDLFQKVESLPHPRWIMQYRYKHQQEFIERYASILQKHISR
ncbi:uracil-DNA glycosylase family protein [Bacteroidota bacterium]